MKAFEHEGIVYNISSYSGSGHSCVGVRMEEFAIRIINTNHPEQKATFTHDEWVAFIAGAKSGEFDIG